VANVTMPTSVTVAGGALCVLAGYLVGYVVSPDTPSRTTASVVSFDSATQRLCLEGDGVKGQPGAGTDGRLCGVWRRAPRSPVPQQGDRFRFVAISSSGEAGHARQVALYGSVVG
jgi:hypothetical protein